MAAKALTERLDSPETLARHLRSLTRRDADLRRIARAAGPFDIRLSPAGFAGLARVVTGQQLSIASARAIWARFEAVPGATEPRRFLRLKQERLRQVGLSAGKYRTIRAIAEAVASGALDFDRLEAMTAEQASTYLTAHKGIGPWTAEIYLMFCAGHPDIFPSGDLALRKAVGHGLGMAELPTAVELSEIALRWSPYRHAAALLFWRYYASVMRKATGTAL